MPRPVADDDRVLAGGSKVLAYRSYWLAMAASLAVVLGAIGPWTRLGIRIDGPQDAAVLTLGCIAFFVLFVAGTDRRWVAAGPLVIGLTAAAIVANDIRNPPDVTPGAGRITGLQWGIYVALAGAATLVLASALLLVDSRWRTRRAASGRSTRARAERRSQRRVRARAERRAEALKRRWWKNRDEPLGSADALERLAEINARSPVPIELPLEATPPASRAAGAQVDQAILREEHHHQYGGPWAAGKYRFEFLVESGLRPEHRLLDVGCGSLRIGVFAIPYLDAGNYFGVESHLVSLEAAATYEIPFHGLEPKRPRLLWDVNFTFSHFGTAFDWIIDSATSTSIGNHPERQAQFFRNIAEVLKPGGRLLIVPRPVVAIEQLEQWGLTLVRGNVVQDCRLLKGHEEDFKSANTWFEFQRI